MADTTKKSKNTTQNNKQSAPQTQSQPPVNNNVKESKKEEVKAPVVTEEPSQVINPNTNQPNPVNINKTNAPKKERVYQQGKGVVKAVLSGDTIVVLQQEQGKPPVEREIQLTNIEAPKLGRRNKNEKLADEPFAFASREFLRKAVIGKQVSYTVEQKSTTDKQSREYGYVYLNQDGKDAPVDLAQYTVQEGWTRVRRRTGKDGAVQTTVRPEVEELNKLEEEAKGKNKGIHSKNPEKHVRPTTEVVATEVYEKLKKAPQQAIVERAMNGSTLFLTLLPTLTEVRLILSGVDCPGQSQDGEWSPFGREAKFCTEFYLLNRDVNVILEGADKMSLYGTVDLRGNNISEELLRRGLAKYVEWSGARTAFVDRLKAAEKAAKDKRINIWANYVEPKVSNNKDDKSGYRPGKEIVGKVVQIISASTISIVDQQNNEHTIQLSSVVLPRGGSLKYQQPKVEAKDTKDEKPTIVGEAPKPASKPTLTAKEKEEALERTYAFEAKEHLRRRLIGQRVRAVIDYIQPADANNTRNQGKAPAKGQQAREEKDRVCCSVYVDKNNIAVELCTLGFAIPRSHRGGEPRSKDYEDMLRAETVAKSQHKGRHQNPDKATPLYINDISSDVDQATKFLPSIKRGKQRGVVQHVFNAGKLKIYVPKENCELTVSIAGVQVPRDKEPFNAESTAFIREKVFQREVEFDSQRVDRGGNFGGSVYFNKESLATALVHEGFAKLMRKNAQELDNYNELENAEESAKRQRKNLWKDYDEAAEREAREKRQAERAGLKAEEGASSLYDVIVTEIIDATTFYIQIAGKEGDQLEELMKNLALDNTPAAADYAPKVDDLVRAQYTADDQFYRAIVTGVEGGKYKVLYVDYGNSETLPASRIRPLSEQFAKLKHQAFRAHLAYIKPPTLNQDYGQEAAELLRDLVDGKTLMAQDEYKDLNSTDYYLSLLDGQLDLAATLVQEGLARVSKPKGRDFTFLQRKTVDGIITNLKKEEKLAKDSRTNIWEYGDVGSDDEDDRSFANKKKEKKDKKPSTSSPATTKKD